MRFIIREQEYEKLLAAGRLKYRSGDLESWRLTEAVEDYKVMRIDLDRRDADASHSTLLHLLLDPDGRCERAKLRDFSAVSDMSIDVLVDHESVSVSRASSEGVIHDDFERPSGFGLLLPGQIGLALFVGDAACTLESPAIQLDSSRRFAPHQVAMKIEALAEERLAVMGQDMVVRPFLISHGDTQQTIWLDKHGLPMRVDDREGLYAKEDRYVRHR
jgi:hypothetical protein